MAELLRIIGFYGRHFVRHLGICNPIYVKLLRIMSGAIPRNLKKPSISNRFPEIHKRGIHTDRHTYDDSRRRHAMRCILPKNQTKLFLLCRKQHHTPMPKRVKGEKIMFLS